MTKYVIGTISNLDAPLTPSVKGSRGLSAYLSGVTEEMMQTERDQILGSHQGRHPRAGCPGTGSSEHRKLLRSRKRKRRLRQTAACLARFPVLQEDKYFEKDKFMAKENRKVRILINCWKN